MKGFSPSKFEADSAYFFHVYFKGEKLRNDEEGERNWIWFFIHQVKT
jgi:hypothetical protein